MAYFIDNKQLYLKNVSEAVDKMLNEDFAFIGESTVEHNLSPEQVCQIQKVGDEPLMKLFHAIGMRKSNNQTIIICGWGGNNKIGFIKCWIMIFINICKDYKHRAELNKALLTLHVDGTISILEERWLRNKYVQCQVSKPIINNRYIMTRLKFSTSHFQMQGSSLDMGKVGGIFCILAGGISLSFTALIIEFVAQKLL